MASHKHKFWVVVVVGIIVSTTTAFCQDIPDSSYLPVNLGPKVNGLYDDILPVIAPDGLTLYFCRSHAPENIGGGRQDIWYSEMEPDGGWSEARNIGIPLNNRENNYLMSITPDGNTIIIGDSYTDPKVQARSIAISRRTVDGWSIPQPITIKNFYNNNRFGEYSLSNNGKTLFMAIERTDTRGGKDLYVSFRENDTTWSEPVNLGPTINSLAHEVTPFIASDDMSLYFSSDGKGGYGAFDVFVSRRQDTTWFNWSEPENLGPTINSSAWDLYYTIPAAGDFAYYVSYNNTYGAGDIFKIRLPKKFRPRAVVLVVGKVLNKKTGEPIEADIFYEVLPRGGESGRARSTPATGKYKIALPLGLKYGFRASAPGFISINDNLDLTQLKEYTQIERNLYLVPIEEGSVAPLNNIFFDYGKADVRSESFPELDRVASMLMEAPSMEIEIGGHTDDRGGDAYNQRLSAARAKNCATYIVDRWKIETKRIKPAGYGESKPVATNETDEGRQQNRRVEVVILKQ
ncbi:MAG: OmpA family protein [Ignavibacteria bacterium]|nr:OmpA family protein [Ignavibacteria bacterium]